MASMLACGVWSVLTFHRLGSALQRTLDENQLTIHLAVEMIYALEREDRAILTALQSGTAQDVAAITLERNSFDSRYQSLKEHVHTREDVNAYAAVRKDVDAFRAAADDLIQDRTSADVLTRYTQEVDPVLRQAIAAVRHFREANVDAMRVAGSHIEEDARGSSLIIGGLTLLAFSVSLSVISLLTRSVMRPIRELDHAVAAIRRDEFEHRVPVWSRDELGRLAEGFNQMAEGLINSRREIEDRFRQLAENINEIFIVSNAAGDRIYYVSPAYAEVWGRSSESLYEDPHSWLTSVHPDDRGAAIANLQCRAKGEFFDLEYRIVRPDGAIRWIRSRAFPFGVASSTEPRVAGLAEDITDRKNVEVEVRRVKERLELAVRSSNQCIWEYDMPDGRLETSQATFINVWESLGYDPEDAPEDVRDAVALAVHPEDKGRVQAAIDHCLKSSDREYELESRVIANCGAVRWHLSRGVVLRDGSGVPKRFVGTSIDITELKEAEEALRKSEQRFRIFADHAADAFFLHDENLVVCDVNKQACESLGYGRDELLGMSPVDFDADTNADDLKSIQAKLLEGQMLSFDSRHRRKDGSTFPVEVRGQLFWEGGRAFTLTLARDVTERRQAERALLESEERFRSTFENAGVGIALCDVKGNFLHVNPSFSRIVGYSDAELAGQSYQAITHPDDLMIDAEQIQQLLRKERSGYSVEKRFVRNGGSDIWVTLSGSVLQCGADGTPRSLIAIIEDISERKRLEEELRISESSFRGIFENAAVGIAQCSLDGRYLQMNQKYGDILRFARGELLGATFSEVVHPEDLASTVEMFERLGRGEILSETQEKRLICKDGTQVWVILTVSLERDQDGNPLRTIGIIEDISERKRLEEELRQSEEQFRLMANSMPHIVWTADLDGTCDYINDRFVEYTGIPASELTWERWFSLVHPDDRERNILEWRAAVEGGRECDLEFRLQAANGTYRWFRGRALPIYGEPGQIIKWIGTTTDVDTQKQSEQVLERAKAAAEAANRAKDEFLANVSHEIRTPMNAILGMTELVLDTPLTDDQRQSLKTVHSAADSLLAIINDLLDFSRIEAGKMELSEEVFSLRALLGDTLRALAVRAHRKGLEIVSHLQPDVPDTLVGDGGRLRQVILNLVGNAIKFTETGEVVVRVTRSEETSSDNRIELVFSVTDTGIGIPKEKHAKVFRAFEQEDSSTTRRYGGTGLGLTIASQIVELMGGSLTLESEVNRGSCFTFSAQFGINPDTTVTGQHLLPIQLKELRTLIVDDNATNRHILTEYLRGWQMDPVAVGDGIAALGALWDAVTGNQPYELVMLDSRMPDTDGLAIAELIRRRSDLSATRLILLTSGDRPGDASRFRDLKIDAHLLKPVQPDELLETIYQVMRGGGESSKETATPGEHHHRATGLHSQSLKILVAEDNEFNAQVLEMYLNKMGHGVHLAANGVDALRFALEQEFDFLLVDIHMPGLDGFEVVSRIRQHEKTTGKHLPTIALTARSRREDREQCLAAGMDDFLTKPFRAEELEAALSRIAGTIPKLVTQDSSPHISGFRILDPRVLLSACGRDDEMLTKVIESFRQHLQIQLVLMREEVRQHDVLQLRETAHKLAGILSAFSTAAAGIASELEDLAAAGQRDEFPEAQRRLEEACEQLLRELNGVSISVLIQHTQMC